LTAKTSPEADENFTNFTVKSLVLGAFPFAKNRLNILGLLCKVFKLCIFNLEEEEEELTMRRLTVLTAAALAAVSIGCSTAANTNVANTNRVMNSNSNVAVVVNSTSNAGMMNSNMSSSNMMNSNVARADYDRDRAKYEADKGTSTIGTGANDSWLWFKTKSALATTNDLRDSTINVDVANDVITLKGTVATAAQKASAEAAAKGIDGQKGIKNELKVQAGDSMTNQMVGGNSNMSNANMKK